MKLIETLIPSKLKNKITEVQSWTLVWEINDVKHYKVFIDMDQLKEYEDALCKCAKFLEVRIYGHIIDNVTNLQLRTR